MCCPDMFGCFGPHFLSARESVLSCVDCGPHSFMPSCCHLPPTIVSALSLAASAIWVLESRESKVRAGGREETYCQGYASEDD